MDWNQLLSTKRTGQSTHHRHHDRTQFQRDYDRLIFSSPFRRMQDKTQVFPLPGSVFVHNRLTHSLEVASVGRSLGNNIAKFLLERYGEKLPLASELGSVVAAACLAHDMGNPPFGHSGEKAISDFFKYGKGQQLKELVDVPEVWNDFTNFEGNANALRVLTHKFTGRRSGGFALTYTTVASIVKYPYASGHKELKKYGFFQSEKEIYHDIATELGIKELRPGVFARHPLVYLVEAADDICYQIMDIEDAHKLGILTTQETRNLLLAFYDSMSEKAELDRIQQVFHEVTDTNEQIAYLRAGVIGKLVNACSDIYIKHHDKILNGEFRGSLVDHLDEPLNSALHHCDKVANEKIYRHPSVVEVEIAGFKILGTLLDEFIQAVLNPEHYYSGLLLPFIPEQYRVSDRSPIHLRIQTVIDFVSGMTDVYALDLFQKIQGTRLGGVKININ
ncbi:dGTP triphosphohydrolase [Thermophagus xiamenensis]|uniref:dGTPase n=1 Tax=Thermophagus xiamenensis TaxID=385682 RepID=A0A1I2E7Q4_9BACT|nr:dNTP triphosphohydrolase [Thermophagus xiamenensis]SFE88290.1 dGTPase [Thermophagus xiamenensis]